MSRAAIVFAVLVGLSSTAGAQITTYIAPPKPAMTQMVASADSAFKDSVAAVAMTNMKAWVDSAAGVTVPATVGDSTVDPGKPELTTFSHGSVAPNTATSLPAVGLFGVVLALAGLAMLMRKRDSNHASRVRAAVASDKPRG